jgi:RNA polymerase sigma factor (sigma-70 family)
VRRFRALPVVALRGDAHSPNGMATPLSRLSEDELRDHGPWLRRVARGLVASESDAEDLAQDVWLELARGAGPIAHLRALSARVARRLAGHRRRAERARGRREAAVARPEALPGPDELEGALQIQCLLLEELTALDELHRTPLMLHFYEGLSAAEIARRRGVPASTVRSQLARALAELRARMDRRHGGQRALWVALVARLPERGTASGTAVAGGAAAGGLLMTTLGKSLLVAGVLGALAVTWRFTRPVGERRPSEVAQAAAPEDAQAPARSAGPGDSPTELEATGTARSARAVAAPTPAVPADVAVLVLDEASGRPLPDFELQLRVDSTRDLLTTDAQGRATIPGHWFEADFQLHLRGDSETPFEDEFRELGPGQRPAPGEELVLRCATGPTYTLLFDAPPPRDAELVVDLSAGSGPAIEPRFTAKLHREGTRTWTRFSPAREWLSSLGDGPWTLTVFDDEGLWRAHGPVRTIVGEQPEPVLLTSASCGTLAVDFTCDVAPQVDDFNVNLYRWVDGRGVEPRYQGIRPSLRSYRFEHLQPGEYQVWVGSPLHAPAGERVHIAAGATVEVRLALVEKANVGSLRVVITSETGQLDVSLVGANARDVATNAWENSTWSGESTSTRRVLLFEGLAHTDYEVSLSGLGRLGEMDASPGRSCIARPGGAELVFTLLDASAPAMLTGRMRVLSSAGEPVDGAGVTTYFEGWGSFLHETDARGEARLEPMLPGVSFDLLVLADGFRPVYLRDLALPFDGDLCEVRLEPGWGAWLDVVLAHGPGRGPDTLLPRRAADADVFVDGVPAGRLDERGQMLLSGNGPPKTIGIRYPGYRVAYGDIDPNTGAPTPHVVHGLWVVLEAEPTPEPTSQER